LNDFSDDILVAASRRGDKEAYALLVRRHYRCVFSVCLGVVGNFHDAEDVAQDAMLKGFLTIRKLRNSERFDQWIYRLAKNMAIDFLRRKGRLKLLAAEKAGHDAHGPVVYAALEDAIRRLPMEIRLPLVLFYLDDKSTASIGERLNISQSSVCKRIKRARKQLHDLLTERVENE